MVYLIILVDTKSKAEQDKIVLGHLYQLYRRPASQLGGLSEAAGAHMRV
jgi:hypothetical protein